MTIEPRPIASHQFGFYALGFFCASICAREVVFLYCSWFLHHLLWQSLVF